MDQRIKTASSIATSQDTPRTAATNEFTFAIICALAIELDAVISVLDDGPCTVPHGRKDYVYLSAKFASHEVLLVRPQQYGKLNTALVAQDLEQQFGRMELIILVGVCGGVPQLHSNNQNLLNSVFLGDVIIGNSTICYMHGARASPQGFDLRSAVSQQTSPKLRQILGYLDTAHYRKLLDYESARVFGQHFGDTKYLAPGQLEDVAFESTYHHMHRGECPMGCCNATPPTFCAQAKAASCSQLGCDFTRARHRPSLTTRPRRIHVGKYASDDVVMRHPEMRDRLAQDHHVLAFDMEGSGISQVNDAFLIIKSVSDYGDSHKHKDWQNYAAACAAATTRVFVECFYPLGKSAKGFFYCNSALLLVTLCYPCESYLLKR